MRRTIWPLPLLLALLAPPMAQASLPDSLATPMTTTQQSALLLNGAYKPLNLEPVVLEMSPREPSKRLSMALDLSRGPEDRTDATLLGMGKVASLVGAIGAFGSSFGMWDDDDAWKMIAAAAAAGATWGAVSFKAN